jgi:hypothetical protein
LITHMTSRQKVPVRNCEVCYQDIGRLANGVLQYPLSCYEMASSS